MVNKKGFVRTLEAVISVVIVLGFIYLITLKTETPTGEIPINIKETQKFVFQEVALNENYRQCIVSSLPGSCSSTSCLQQINQFISDNKPSGFNHACEVCDRSLSCSNPNLPLDRSVYTDSMFIGKDNFKVFRVYFWEV